MATTYTGKIKWFDSEKGFGFVTEEYTEKEFFIHHKSVKYSGKGRVHLDEGEEVTFQILIKDHKEQAGNVKLVNSRDTDTSESNTSESNISEGYSGKSLYESFGTEQD